MNFWEKTRCTVGNAKVAKIDNLTLATYYYDKQHSRQSSKITFFCLIQGPVVRRLISVNQALNFHPGFFNLIIFSILLRTSDHQIVGKTN